MGWVGGRVGGVVMVMVCMCKRPEGMWVGVSLPWARLGRLQPCASRWAGKGRGAGLGCGGGGGGSGGLREGGGVSACPAGPAPTPPRAPRRSPAPGSARVRRPRRRPRRRRAAAAAAAAAAAGRWRRPLLSAPPWQAASPWPPGRWGGVGVAEYRRITLPSLLDDYLGQRGSQNHYVGDADR